MKPKETKELRMFIESVQRLLVAWGSARSSIDCQACAALIAGLTDETMLAQLVRMTGGKIPDGKDA